MATTSSLAIRKETARIEPARNGAPYATDAALAIRRGQSTWDEQQRAALVALGIPAEAPQADLDVFHHVCQRTGLDPFAKQIYLLYRRVNERVNRNGKWIDNWVNKPSIQTGIDGFRVNRDRSAARLGILVDYEDTVWFDAEGSGFGVWLWDAPPTACKFVVRLSDGRRFPSVLRFNEYAQRNGSGDLTGRWAAGHAHQIEKCAEADALRRAFPQDFSGLVLEDAAQGDIAEPEPPKRQPQRVTGDQLRQRRPQSVPAEVVPDDAPPASGEIDYDTPGTVLQPQLTAIWTALKSDFEYTDAEKEAARETCAIILGRAVESTKTLSRNEAGRVLDRLGAWKQQAVDEGGSPRDYLLAALQAAEERTAADPL
jgi:phage recombination protein Bet